MFIKSAKASNEDEMENIMDFEDEEEKKMDNSDDDIDRESL